MNNETEDKKVTNETNDSQKEFNVNEVLNNKPESVDENSALANQLVDENHNK
ncbi:YitT family protein, partial [Escherichia coli]|nr:YitT family protein [Escherichia coli]